MARVRDQGTDMTATNEYGGQMAPPQATLSPRRVRGLAIALVKPLAGKEQDFSDWFGRKHAPGIGSRLKGYRTAQLFRATKLRAPRDTPYDYLAAYEVDPDQCQHPASLLDGAPGIAHVGALPQTGASRPVAGNCVALVFTAISDRIVAPAEQDLPPASAGELPPLSEVGEVSIVFSKPVAGQESEYNHWYSNEHVPEVVGRLKGYNSGQRFRLADLDPPQPSAYRYLAFYEISAERSRASVGWLQKVGRPAAAAAAAAGHGKELSLSPALHDDRVTWIYSAVTRCFEAP